MNQQEKILSSNIKAERIRAGLSQEDIASILNKSRTWYINFEKNPLKYKSVVIFELSKIFNCNPDDFFVGINLTDCQE